MSTSKKPPSRTRRLLGRAGQVVTGVNVLFNLSGSPRAPEADVARSQQFHAVQQAETQKQQRRWATHQKNQVLPRWRTQAAELRDQLREPLSSEQRPSEQQRHDVDLSRQPSRSRNRSERGRAR